MQRRQALKLFAGLALCPLCASTGFASEGVRSGAQAQSPEQAQLPEPARRPEREPLPAQVLQSNSTYSASRSKEAILRAPFFR